MDELLKNKITKKRGKILFTYGVQCINTPTSKRYICMLQMLITIMTAGWVSPLKTFLLLKRNCKIQACWSGAVVTTITTELVWCKCNRQHRELDVSITNKNTRTGKVQVFQACMRVGASLTDMTAG